jgi:hypothetical protein
MSTRSHLLALPPELHLEIFKHLHPVSSTCLGLTCKEFYPIHKQLHGVVNLRAKIPAPPRKPHYWGFVRLGALLNTWAGPKYWFGPWNDGRFKEMTMPKMESRKEINAGEEE